MLEGDAPFVQMMEQREENEDEIAARRARVRERLRAQAMARQQQSEPDDNEDFKIKIPINEQVPSSSKLLGLKGRYESESEYETDTDTTSSSSEDEEILKPVFVPRSKRITIQEMDAKAEEETRRAEKALARKEQRKQETRELVAESVRKMVICTLRVQCPKDISRIE